MDTVKLQINLHGPAAKRFALAFADAIKSAQVEPLSKTAFARWLVVTRLEQLERESAGKGG